MRETELFLESQLREDRSVIQLLNADYTFLNERLARHYGIPGVYGSRFRKVTLEGSHRAGLLGHGRLMTVTSYPNRTSPRCCGGNTSWRTSWGLRHRSLHRMYRRSKRRTKMDGRSRCARRWFVIGQTPPVPRVIRRWIRSGSRWRTSMPSEGSAWSSRDANRCVRVDAGWESV